MHAARRDGALRARGLGRDGRGRPRLDGGRGLGGYPDGLAGEDIPLGARIVGVCDAYDAMVTERPYRDPMDPEDAIAELERNAGSQFDSDVVAAFVAVHATADHAGRATV